jgi:hypothetical protein
MLNLGKAGGERKKVKDKRCRAKGAEHINLG